MRSTYHENANLKEKPFYYLPYVQKVLSIFYTGSYNKKMNKTPSTYSITMSGQKVPSIVVDQGS